MRKYGFTLIELIVSLCILTILATTLVCAVRSGVEQAKDARCKLNLHALAMAAIEYANDHMGTLPWAMKSVNECWDFKTDGGDYEPGILYDYTGSSSILMCPSCAGKKDNWAGGGMTGYNYNSSYAGKVKGERGKRECPSDIDRFPDTSKLALFGDGGYGEEPEKMNKFMRAPKSDKEFDSSSGSIRRGGTQSFRHRGHTNVAFADGHVEGICQSYKQDGSEGFVAGKTGFISPDNSLYSGNLNHD